MFIKPDYCVKCGQKVDRINWKPWTSSHFCEVCEYDFKIHEWIPKIIGLCCLIFGFWGIGKTFLTEEKPLNLTSRQLVETSADNRKTVKKDVNSSVNSAEAANSNAVNTKKAEENRGQSSLNPNQIAQTQQPKSVKQTSEEETTFYCGAETKKGTPCSRKVKGGGRCWQHKGQAAVLPPEKLIAVK